MNLLQKSVIQFTPKYFKQNMIIYEFSLSVSVSGDLMWG